MQNKYLAYKDIIRVSLESSPNQSIHWHDCLEIILVTEGAASLHVSFEKIELKENQLMVVNSSEPHRIYCSSEQSELVCVSLDRDYCYSIYDNLYEALAVSDFDVTFMNLNENSSVLASNIHTLINLLSSIEEPSDENDDLVFRSISTFLNNLVSSYMPKPSNEYLTKKVPKEKIEMIHRLIRYLYDNYDQDVDLQTFSDQEFFNFYYVSHNIKEITGTSFRDWLNYVRVEQSEKLLLNTDKSITTISEECGFSDVRYYNKHFLKWHKVSPLNFRRLFKQSHTGTPASTHDKQDSITNPASGLTKYLSTVRKESEKANTSREIQLDFNEIPIAGHENQNSLAWSSLACSVDLISVADYRDRLSVICNELKTKKLFINFSAEEIKEPSFEVDRLFCGILDLASRGMQMILSVPQVDSYGAISPNIRELISRLNMEKSMQPPVSLRIEPAKDGIRMDEYYKAQNMFQCELEQMAPNIVLFQENREHLGTVRKILEAPMMISDFLIRNGLKSTQYHMKSILSNSSNRVILETDEYIVCGQTERFTVIIYNNGALPLLNQRYLMKLQGIRGAYKQVEYRYVYSDSASADFGNNQMIVEMLDHHDKEMINWMTFPKVSFDCLVAAHHHEIVFKVVQNEILICDFVRASQ